MKANIIFGAVCLLLLAGFMTVAGNAVVYRLDLDGPIQLHNDPPTLPTPTEVQIFVGAVKKDFDKTPAETFLSTKSFSYQTTNKAEISNLISILQQMDNKERIPNSSRRPGLTYHLLLFQEQNHTVMHYRIFQPTDLKTDWFSVFPRSSSGFGYFNKPIGPWLHERVTNAPPVVPADKP